MMVKRRRGDSLLPLLVILAIAGSSITFVPVTGLTCKFTGLTATPVPLKEAFSSDKLAYTLVTAAASTTFTITASDPACVITVQDASGSGGLTTTLPLFPGTFLPLAISLTNSSSIVITISAVPPCELSGLTLDHGQLSPPFFPRAVNYLVDVGTDVLTVTAEAGPNCFVSVNGKLYNDTAVQNVKLEVGPNPPINLAVATPVPGGSPIEYSVTPTRINLTLDTLDHDFGAMSTPFSYAETTYVLYTGSPSISFDLSATDPDCLITRNSNTPTPSNDLSFDMDPDSTSLVSVYFKDDPTAPKIYNITVVGVNIGVAHIGVSPPIPMEPSIVTSNLTYYFSVDSETNITISLGFDTPHLCMLSDEIQGVPEHGIEAKNVTGKIYIPYTEPVVNAQLQIGVCNDTYSIIYKLKFQRVSIMLASLAVTLDDGQIIPLDPTFSRHYFNYDAKVGEESTANVTALPFVSSATVSIGDKQLTGKIVNERLQLQTPLTSCEVIVQHLANCSDTVYITKTYYIQIHNKSKPPDSPMIIGVTVGVACLVALAIAFVFYYRRYKEAMARRASFSFVENEENIQATEATPLLNDELSQIAYKRLCLEHLAATMQSLTANNGTGFEQQMDGIKYTAGKTSHKVANDQKNVPKNRSQYIVPTDEGLVSVNGVGYINASSIGKSGCSFIATQRPLESTLGDFWKLLWENQVEAIIMVEESEEPAYWPLDDEPKMIGRLKITSDGPVIPTEYGYERRMQMELTQHRPGMEELPRTLNQYVCTKWRTAEQPNITDIINLVLHVKKSVIRPQNPIVCHCSTGGLKTSVVIAALMCLHKFDHCDRVNVSDIVREIITQRSHTIESANHLKLIYKVVEALLDTRFAQDNQQ